MKDAYYFPHDSNARNDEKCMYIIGKYGLEGYGLYWVLIESMHEQNDGKLTCSLMSGLAFRWKVEITMLEQFYNDAITIGLFVTDGDKFWSERVIRNKQLFEEKRQKRSEAGKLGMQKRWASNNAVITMDNTVITKYNKGKESKVKQSKVDEIKTYLFNYTENNELIDALNSFVEMRKHIKKPMTDKAIKLMLDKLDEFSHRDDEKIAILNQSIMNCWQGIFPLKDANKGKFDDLMRWAEEYDRKNSGEVSGNGSNQLSSSKG